MEKNLKRISLMIKEDQYESITSKGFNLSGLVRDLLDDYLSAHKITVSVTEETKDLYDRIISNTGSTDLDIEPYVRTALEDLLKDKIQSMKKLHETAFGQRSSK